MATNTIAPASPTTTKSAATGTLSGFGALQRIYRRYVLTGAAMFATGIALLFVGSGLTAWFLPSIAIGAGGCFIALGLWGSRVGAIAPVLSTSLNLIQAGKTAEAATLLDSLKGQTLPGVLSSIRIQRAMIAVRAGDLKAAVLYCSEELQSSPRFLFKSTDDLQRATARGIRAFAYAALGEFELATADVNEVRTRASTADALAHAALAEALVLERQGQKDALNRVLVRERRLLSTRLDMRERSIYRAMQRLLKSPKKSVYRTAAETKHKDNDEELSLGQWFECVAPELSAFAPKSVSVPQNNANLPLPELAPSAQAIEQTKLAPPSRAVSGTRVAVLWVILVAMVFAIWQVLRPETRIPGQRTISVLETPWAVFYGVFVAAALVALFVRVLSRTQKDAKTLHRLSVAIAKGEDVDSELRELSRSKQTLTAAQAYLIMASNAERRGALKEAIQLIDSGRDKLKTVGARAAAGGSVGPALTAARAYTLAALQKTDLAAAELLQIPKDYVFYDRTQFAVRLVALVATGDFETANRLIEQTPPDLTIGSRDELIRDLVRAALAKDGANAAEIARLRDELRDDEESRKWIELVAPSLLTRFHETTQIEGFDSPDRVRVHSGEDGLVEVAEAEAQAEAEIAEPQKQRANIG